MLIQLADYLSQFDAGFPGVPLHHAAHHSGSTHGVDHLVHGRSGDDSPSQPLLKIGQTVRNDGPQTHLSKSGTPTMGGALILVAVAVATLFGWIWATVTLWIVLLTTLAFGAMGCGTTTANWC